MKARHAILESAGLETLRTLAHRAEVDLLRLRHLADLKRSLYFEEELTTEEMLVHLDLEELRAVSARLGLLTNGDRRDLLKRLEARLGPSRKKASRRKKKSPARTRLSWKYLGVETFVALDFETADRKRDSACSLALVRVEKNQIVRTESRLIRPPRKEFEFTRIHGLTWEMVQDAPDFAAVWTELEPMLEGASFLVAHNASFDRSVLKACCEAAGLAPPALPFHCSVALARRRWSLRRARLPDVCAFLGIPLRHHDATSDAQACARIVLASKNRD